MLTWPLVKIECVVQNVRIQKISNVDTFFNDCVQVVKEKVMRNETVLIITKVGNDSFTSTILIEVDSSVQSISIAEFLLFMFSFIHFIFVEDWILCLKQVLKLITKQICHTSGVKT
jgi:hypothetical protein